MPSSWCAGATCSTASCATSARSARCSETLGAEHAARFTVADRLQGNRRPALRFRAPRARDRRARGLSAAPRLFSRGPRAGAAGVRRCSPAAMTRRAGDPRGGGDGVPARRRLRRLGRDRARRQPQAQEERPALVAVPAPVDADVLHRARPRDALLHRAVLAARLRQLYAWAMRRRRRLREIWNGDRIPGLPHVPC